MSYAFMFYADDKKKFIESLAFAADPRVPNDSLTQLENLSFEKEERDE